MTPPEFEVAFAKIKKRWPKFYSEDMEVQAFQICKDLPLAFFNDRTNEVLWSERPPKIEWFYEILARRRRHEDVKSELRQMHAAEDSRLDAPTISMMKEYGYRRINGKLDHKEYADFQKQIRELISSDPRIKCKICLDQGFYLPYGAKELFYCKTCDLQSLNNFRGEHACNER